MRAAGFFCFLCIGFRLWLKWRSICPVYSTLDAAIWPIVFIRSSLIFCYDYIFFCIFTYLHYPMHTYLHFLSAYLHMYLHFPCFPGRIQCHCTVAKRSNQRESPAPPTPFERMWRKSRRIGSLSHWFLLFFRAIRACVNRLGNPSGNRWEWIGLMMTFPSWFINFNRLLSHLIGWPVISSDWFRLIDRFF